MTTDWRPAGGDTAPPAERTQTPAYSPERYHDVLRQGHRVAELLHVLTAADLPNKRKFSGSVLWAATVTTPAGSHYLIVPWTNHVRPASLNRAYEPEPRDGYRVWLTAPGDLIGPFLLADAPTPQRAAAVILDHANHLLH